VDPRDGAIEEKPKPTEQDEYAAVGAFWEDALLTGVFTRIDEARIFHERRPMTDDLTSTSGASNGSAELTIRGKSLRYEVTRDTLAAFDGDVSRVLEILADMSTHKDAIDENENAKETLETKAVADDRHPEPLTTEADETGEATVDPITTEEVNDDGGWVSTKTTST